MMTFQQYEASLHWFYDKIEATAPQPQPQIRLLNEDPVVLQATWPADIVDIPPGELQPRLSSLVKVLGYILNHTPVLTSLTHF